MQFSLWRVWAKTARKQQRSHVKDAFHKGGKIGGIEVVSAKVLLGKLLLHVKQTFLQGRAESDANVLNKTLTQRHTRMQTMVDNMERVTNDHISLLRIDSGMFLPGKTRVSIQMSNADVTL
eukprot:3667423-Amphidinium_carterae.1